MSTYECFVVSVYRKSVTRAEHGVSESVAEQGPVSDSPRTFMAMAGKALELKGDLTEGREHSVNTFKGCRGEEVGECDQEIEQWSPMFRGV